jgi:uncharacterized peroxidase-related enzyme
VTDQPTALDLPMVDPLPEATQKYFDVCTDKLGMVPNVLQAYAFDIDKLNAFTALYNDVMLAHSGLSKLEREMIAVAVSSINKCYYCLTAHGAAVRQLSGDPKLGEMSRGPIGCAATCDADFCGTHDRGERDNRRKGP